MEYDVVIGLEIHSELKTATKAFCSCKNEFGASINTHVCPVCMGLPGALPTINTQAVKLAIKAGLAFDCQILNEVVFERKNYFYPDLSKAYQISQLEKPQCLNGKIRYVDDGIEKICKINNIHMEEDAGKSIHDEKMHCSLIDYNRCGVPLIEIVTEPDLHSASEAMAVLQTIKETLIATNVSDCKMQEGSLRCDVNLSLKPKGSVKLGTRTEMKNLNSFKAVGRAIEYEISRQKQVLDGGGKIVQETLRWDDFKGKNFSLRSKAESNDYRYFPDPDLLPLNITNDYIQKIKEEIPELPFDKKNRYVKELNLPEYDASVLTNNSVISAYFEECLTYYNKPKSISNFIMSYILRLLKDSLEEEINIKISAKNLTKLIQMFDEKQITVNSSKLVLEKMWENGESPEKIVEELGLKIVNNQDEIKQIVEQVIASNPQAVQDYKSGNERAITFFIGQSMKLSKGKANPQIVTNLVKDLLSK